MLSDLGPKEKAEKIYSKFLSLQHTALSSYCRRQAAKECAALHLRLELESMAPHLTSEGIEEYREVISMITHGSF